MVAQVQDVYDRHPEWHRQRRHLSVRDDRDRPYAVPANVQRSLPRNASLVALWHQGREQAIVALDNSKQFPHRAPANFFRELSEAADNGKGVSLLRPGGVMIGSTVQAAVDEEGEDVGDVVEEGEGEEDTLEAAATAAAASDEEEEGSIMAELQVAQAAGSNCWLKVDGGDVHKAAVVRTIFGTSPSSTDRTRRVYGASKFGEARKAAAAKAVQPVDDTALICVGDPVAAVVSVDRTAPNLPRWRGQCLVIMCIDTIKLASGKTVASVPTSELQGGNHKLQGNLLQLQQVAADCEAPGGSAAVVMDEAATAAAGEPAEWRSVEVEAATRLEVQSAIVLQLQPAVMPPTGTAAACYIWTATDLAEVYATATALTHGQQLPKIETGDAQLPYTAADGSHPFATVALANGNDTPGMACKICGVVFTGKDKQQLRVHVGLHMLQSTDPEERLRMCGFCGGSECVPRVNKTGQVEASSCSNDCFVKTSRKPCEEDGAHCCNYPVPCPKCSVVVWKYALSDHWRAKHVQLPQPAGNAWFVVGKQEQQYMDNLERKAERGARS